MKRLILLSTLLVAALALPLHAASAAPHPRGHRFLARTVIDRAGPSLPTRRMSPLSTDRRPSQAGAVLSDAQLRLPVAAFPTGSSLQDDHAMAASDADNSRFSAFHVSSYASLGMQGGWIQYYTTQMSDGVFDVVYLGSYYPTAAAARQAFLDVSTNPKFPHGTACNTGSACFEDGVSLAFSDGTYSGQYRIVLQGNAIAEIISVVPDADYYSLIFTIQANIERVTTSFLIAVAAASPAPTATLVPTAPPPTAVATQAPTNTPAPTATATGTATATATSTPLPLFVHLTLAHRTVKPGARQSITITTLAGATVRVALAFPDGAKKSHSGTAGDDGAYTWAFRQPASHAGASGHTVKITVTVSNGTSGPVTAKGSYSVG